MPKERADLAEGGDGAVNRTVARWRREIDAYDREFADWQLRGQKIVRRFRDDRDENDAGRRSFSLLYANTETMAPVLYGATPKAVVKRRNRDRSPAANIAAQLGQRFLNYLIERDDGFDDACSAAVQDYQLPGRGEVWLRYEAKEEEFVPRVPVAPQYGEDPATGASQVRGYADPQTGKRVKPELVKQDEEAGESYVDGEPDTRIAEENVFFDYIDWLDLGHTAGARRWEEVEAVWKHEYLTRAELVKRFGPKGRQVKLNVLRARGSEKGRKDGARYATKRGKVTEVWIKAERRTIWIGDGYDSGVLDQREGMYDLPDYFPGPRPLLSLSTNDQLVPVPDYAQYQDQAQEIDGLTDRISLLQKSLRVRGLYPGSSAEIRSLLDETLDTELIPVGDWAQLIEKGGLKEMVHWFPVDMFAEVIKALYEIRQKAKEDAYEVTGISDIIRGQSQASETATAQDIKNRWGSIRVRRRQQAVQKFVRALLALTFNLVCNQCSDETILAWADAQEMEGYGTEEFQQLLVEAMAILRDPQRRKFKIDIETDSTVLVDEQAEMEERSKLLTAVGGFLQSALPIMQAAPMMAPALGKMLMFTVRSFRPGAELEAEIERGIGQFVQMAMQAAQQGPQPDPKAQAEAEKAKVEAQATVEKTRASVAKTQADIQRDNMMAERDQQRQDREMVVDAQHADQDRRANMHAKVIAAVAGAGRGGGRGGGQR